MNDAVPQATQTYAISKPHTSILASILCDMIQSSAERTDLYQYARPLRECRCLVVHRSAYMDGNDCVHVHTPHRT